MIVGNIQLPGGTDNTQAAMPRENTTEGLDLSACHSELADAGSGSVCRVTTDARAPGGGVPGRQITLEVVDSTGTRVITGFGCVEIRLADCHSPTDGNYHRLYIQEIDVSVPDGGGGWICKKAMALISDAY